MKKQEAIKGIKDEEILGDYHSEHSEGFNEGLKTALTYVKEIDEPEKPILPQYIADWLEVCKENLGFGLATAMSHSTSVMKKQSNKVQGWFNLKSNQETFAKAWLYGYEVKKLYTVEIPNPNRNDSGTYYLSKNKDGKVEMLDWCNYNFADDWKKEQSAQLTEAEIKEDFEWAWNLNFQKEVL